MSHVDPTHETPLADVLARFAGREMLFVEPGGNWGDQLIYRGAEALARRLHVEFTRLTYEAFLARPADAVPVYVHGGGGFNTFTSGKAPSAFLFALRHYRGTVVLGPTTVDATDGFLEAKLLPELRDRAAGDVVMFTRERTSHAALAGRIPDDIPLYLDHDTALHCTPDDILDGRPRGARYDLLALREDDEAPPGGLPLPIDGVRLDPAYYARSFDHWVRLHALAARIVTNRAHSAMIGAVLNKPTTLSRGSYHKNRSLWEYSLSRRGVAWLEAPPGRVVEPETPPAWQELPLLGRVARSSKVDRTLKRLRGVPWQ
jgi:hypothetical protein